MELISIKNGIYLTVKYTLNRKYSTYVAIQNGTRNECNDHEKYARLNLIIVARDYNNAMVVNYIYIVLQNHWKGFFYILFWRHSMCVYVCIYMYVYMYIYIYIYVYVYICICIYVCIYI